MTRHAIACGIYTCRASDGKKESICERRIASHEKIMKWKDRNIEARLKFKRREKRKRFAYVVTVYLK